MDRYDVTKTIKVVDKRGRLLEGFDKRTPLPARTLLAQTRYPVIERESEDIFIETRIGDRFDMLAHEFYGDVTLWWIIAKANILINGSLAVEPGIKLRIPTNTEAILNNFYRLNN
tara:strand:- start:844 stop:1188 length:345 start_codon:yes stop_codon:yes gene_type:complete